MSVGWQFSARISELFRSVTYQHIPSIDTESLSCHKEEPLLHDWKGKFSSWLRASRSENAGHRDSQ